MDNAIATKETGHSTMEHTVHEHPHWQKHHFETVEQQSEAARFGMWLFLLTEIMFFGGLFMAYLLYRNWYNPAFVVASHQLSIPLGAANTAILITSGFFMALGVWAAEMRKKRQLMVYLILTTIFGLAFLGIKAVEYHEKWEHSHIPGIKYSIAEFVNPPAGSEDKPLGVDMAQKTELFFFLYFAMTGMHALHMIIGIGLLGILMARTQRGDFTTGHVAQIENFGLYWHFVDIVWIFLFPLLYLINLHAPK